MGWVVVWGRHCALFLGFLVVVYRRVIEFWSSKLENGRVIGVGDGNIDICFTLVSTGER